MTCKRCKTGLMMPGYEEETLAVCPNCGYRLLTGEEMDTRRKLRVLDRIEQSPYKLRKAMHKSVRGGLD